MVVKLSISMGMVDIQWLGWGRGGMLRWQRDDVAGDKYVITLIFIGRDPETVRRMRDNDLIQRDPKRWAPGTSEYINGQPTFKLGVHS